MFEHNKKKQHYVWESYLRAWVVDGKIWCRRQGKIFRTSTENVGQERYFYSAESLTDEERDFVRRFILEKTHPSSHAMHLSAVCLHDSVTCGSEIIKRNALEEYHAQHEERAVEFYRSIRENGLSFLDQKQPKIRFCHFVGLQYTRTKAMQQRLIDGCSEVLRSHFYEEAFSMQRVVPLLALLVAQAVGLHLYSRSVFHISHNDTDHEFITGDQPIVNLAALNAEKPEDIEQMDLYYPISPTKALFAVDDDSNLRDRFSKDDVKTKNEIIVAQSHEQVFSSRESSLEAAGKG